MGEVSGRAALRAGFDLIRREPGVVLAWALVYFVLGALPQLWLVWIMWPVYVDMMLGNFDPQSQKAAELSVQSNGAQLLSWVTSVLVQALLAGAAFRAVLMPKEGGVFYLRLGGREAWLALCLVVMMVMLFLGLLVAALPLGFIIAIAAVVGGAGPAALLGLVAFAAAMVVFLWAWLRLSMGPVMSFAERSFRLFESWGLTRGHASRMFSVALVIFAVTVAAEIVVFAFGAAAVNVIIPLETLRHEFAADAGAVVRQLAPVIVAAYLAMTVIGTMFYVLYGAAWADMYRQLRNEHADVFA